MIEHTKNPMFKCLIPAPLLSSLVSKSVAPVMRRQATKNIKMSLLEIGKVNGIYMITPFFCKVEGSRPPFFLFIRKHRQHNRKQCYDIIPAQPCGC